jgi:hypothetical protein
MGSTWTLPRSAGRRSVAERGLIDPRSRSSPSQRLTVESPLVKCPSAIARRKHYGG